MPKAKLWIMVSLLTLAVSSSSIGVFQLAAAWSNGRYSLNSSDIGYGTHDWMAEHALDMLPSNESGWLAANKNVFLLGTEAPENANITFGYKAGYGDIQTHHNYYSGPFPKDCTDDSASVRAEEEYQKALACLRNSSYELAAWYAGAMSHYISDMGSWPHVINNATPNHAREYEELLGLATDVYAEDPGYVNIEKDRSAVSVGTAYGETLWLGIGTYSDGGGWHSQGQFSAASMDSQFREDWSSMDDMPQMYRMRIGYCVEASVLAVANTLHGLTIESGFTGEPRPFFQFAEPALFIFAVLAGAAFVFVVYICVKYKNTRASFATVFRF